MAYDDVLYTEASTNLCGDVEGAIQDLRTAGLDDAEVLAEIINACESAGLKGLKIGAAQ